MSPSHVLALDQGTTSSRALVVDEAGTIVASASRRHAQLHPRPGWIEHDPEELFTNLQACVSEVLAAAHLGAGDLVAIGCTNQRETTLLWERATGRPLYNAIVWQDRRTAGLCRTLRDAGLEAQVAAKTGLVLDPYFSATKLAWLLDHCDGARARAGRGELCFGTVDAWLCWKISGGKRHRSEATNASRTSLFSLEALEWDEELLSLFDVPREVLPELALSSTPVLERGETNALFSAEGPALTGVLGDQQASLFAQACFHKGQAKATFGTGTFVLAAAGASLPEDRNGLLATVAGRANGECAYALEGAVLSSGGTLEWLSELGIVEDPGASEALARSLQGNDDVWFVPALSGLGAPHWDATARGTLLGVTASTTRAHLARAALEGIAHETVDVLDAMASAGRGVEILRVDGGVAANSWLMEQVSDLSGICVDVAAERESTALGAAYLAGIRAGIWRDEEEVASLRQSARTIEPSLAEEGRLALRARWADARDRSRAWAGDDVAADDVV